MVSNVEYCDRSLATWLFSPIGADTFFSEYYQRKPLHIERGSAKYYEGYFGLAEVERIVFGTGLRTPDLHVFKDGVHVRTELYTEATNIKLSDGTDAKSEIIEPDRVSALFASGCTLNLVSVSKFSPVAAAFNGELEKIFGCHINPNVYVTPAGNQGFAIHYDTHDTIIVQIEGSKLWRIFGAPIELPLDEQRWSKQLQQPGDLQMEFVMNPGDLLYIPRGFCHEAKANDDLSVHLTFGLFPPRWVKVLTEALNKASETDVRLRRLAEPGEALAGIAKIVPDILNESFITETLTRAQERFWTGRHNSLDAQFQQIAALERLSESSLIAKRPGLTYVLEETDQNVKLRFSGKTLLLAKSAAAIINELENVSSVTLGNLAKHDGKVTNIVKRLIQEGFALQLFDRKTTHESVA